MKRVILPVFAVLVFLVALSLPAKPEELKVMKPTRVGEIDISQEAQDRYEQWIQLRERMDAQNLTYADLTEEEKLLIDEFPEDMEFWSTVTMACSWYCGGGPDRVLASSFLAAQSGNTYVASNAHDFDLRTAWVEGVKGYGIGEFIEFYFRPFGPRVTEIYIFNGYFKSIEAWENNSRVKRLKFYVGKKPYAILELEDCLGVQVFSVEPLQSVDKNLSLVLRFEILEVYPGKKWDDVAISEINFDGLDVHCFVKGTKIAMADGTEKAIELIAPGDKIMSFNLNENKLEQSVVAEVASVIHDNLVILDFGSTAVTATDDHPFYIKGKGWCSVSPEKTQIYRNMENAKSLAVGDAAYFLDAQGSMTTAVLQKITPLENAAETYTVTKLEGQNGDFFANGLLVGVEEL